MRTAQQAISLLWSKAAPSLTDSELQGLAGADAEALMMIEEMASVFEDIGSMVLAEDGATGISGAFQSQEQAAALLFMASRQCDTAAALLFLGGEASELRALRKGYEATTKSEEESTATPKPRKRSAAKAD